MHRRLAALWLVVVPLLAACGQRPLLSVGIQRVVVQPNASLDTVPEDISYTIGAPAHVRVTLVQPNGQTLLLRDNDRAPDSYAIPFGGIVDVPNTQDRRVLQNGDYKILFQAQGKDGQTAEQSVDAVVKNADPVPLDIKDITLSLPVFEPNGQGVRQINGHLEDLDQTVINYSLSKNASVSMWAVDKDGNQTAITADPKAKAGLQSVTWQGKGPDGIALKDGVYTLHIKADDESGNVTERNTQVTIQNSGTPQVQVMSARFLPTALGIGGTIQVEITVKNIGDVAIRTQGPPPGTVFKSNTRYTDPSFNRPGDAEPPYEDKPGIWRVGVDWTSSSGTYPARWGFFQDDSRMLQPGEQVTVRGAIQLLAPQPPDVDFWASVEMGGIGFMDQFGRTHVVVGH